jgi:hypothetical protein
LREVLIVEMRDVGRERESSIAMIVLWIERTLEWNVVIGEEVVGARIWT